MASSAATEEIDGGWCALCSGSGGGGAGAQGGSLGFGEADWQWGGLL